MIATVGLIVLFSIIGACSCACVCVRVEAGE